MIMPVCSDRYTIENCLLWMQDGIHVCMLCRMNAVLRARIITDVAGNEAVMALVATLQRSVELKSIIIDTALVINLR